MLICNMKKQVIIILILSLFVCVLGFAGEMPKTPMTKTVMLKGKIIDYKSNELLAGVKIACNGCEKFFYSDLDGNFFISFKVNSNEDSKIEFSQIGYSSKTFDIKELQAHSDNLYIDLQSK